jgi:hypothetical protein
VHLMLCSTTPATGALMEWGVTVVGILVVAVVVRDMFRTLFHPVGHGTIAPHAVRTARQEMGHPAPPDGVPARTRAQDVTHTGRRK